MIAHMQAEALKHGKDWLRAKMVDTSDESRAQVLEAIALANLPDKEGAAEQSSPPPQKANKHQRSEGKPARKTAKKSTVRVWNTEEDTSATPEYSLARAPAEGEHINTIIKE
ncbi:hypothetical protein NDU88_008356 [Pleurodeles waltl]|uniref:Uncharacterized protein n=1 Tax=Pleurodeles waltl TaxID=8319 RepID=A0AAV7PRN5_PLEWA|nr:hypothetical protein NDU88_008356 [Pleurodeles waltl]